MTYDIVLKQFKEVEADYNTPDSLIDGGEMYCIAHKLAQELTAAQEEITRLKKTTNLRDITGKEIMIGSIVHWTDGGDDLPLEERIDKRWDRIAVVDRNPDISFTVVDSPHKEVKQTGHTFNYGHFIYTDTAKYLTIVAENQEEYNKKFKNAGECMAWVLQQKDK